MFYVVGCVRTLELYNFLRRNYDVFTPVERIRTPQGVVEVAALGGLIFTGISCLTMVREQFTAHHRTRQIFTSIGTPMTVPREGAYEMQRALNEEFNQKDPIPVLPNYAPGEPVTVCLSDDCHIQGSVTKVKTDGRVRVRGPIGYMDVTPSRLKHGLYTSKTLCY